MTAQTTAQAPVRPVLARLGATALRFMTAFASASHAARCAREAERLFALSDAELARRGMTRDQIIHRAFGPYLHI